MQFFTRTKRIYLDYAAATPLHADVVKAMKPYLTKNFGNPGAVHEEGRLARAAIESARTSLARMLHVRTSEVTFAGSGTEANNIAITGYIEALTYEGRSYSDIEIITTKIEHPSILLTVERLRDKGVVVRYADVIKDDGRINEASLTSLLSRNTALVTFAYVNSEIGTVQEVKKFTRAIKKWNTAHNSNIKVHLDAAQAPLWLPCQMDMLGVDMMTLDAGKCYGPKGVGVLVHIGKTKLLPIVHGGGQEKGLRSGTESPALIVGAVASLIRAEDGREARVRKIEKLRDTFFEYIEKDIPEAVVNGSRTNRVANNVHISIPHADSEYAVVALDAKGIAAATKSACSSAKGAGSYVVREISDEVRANSTLRFTLGEETTRSHITIAVSSLAAHLASMKMYRETK